MEVLPQFTAYLQQSLPALNTVSNLIEVVITGCCKGCEGVTATGDGQIILADQADPQPQEHVVYHVSVPAADEFEDDDCEDGEAVEEWSIDPYEMPDLTDPEHEQRGSNEQFSCVVTDNVFWCGL